MTVFHNDILQSGVIPKVLIDALSSEQLLRRQPVKCKFGVQVDRIDIAAPEGSHIRAYAKYQKGRGLPIAIVADLHPALHYEAAAYRFLMSIRKDFKYFPTVLANKPGLLILEDLGDNDFIFDSERDAQFAALNCLAKLHGASTGKRSDYETICADMFIPLRDKRLLPAASNDFAYTAGLRFLRSLSAALSIDMKPLDHELELALETAKTPEIFDCFLHNDFVDPRQSVVRNGDFYLLDFEHARFGHALNDVFQLYFGKIEYSATRQIWFRKSLKVFDGALEHYRRCLEQVLAQPIHQDVWALNVGSVCLNKLVEALGAFIIAPKRFSEAGLACRADQSFHVQATILINMALKFLDGNAGFKDSVDVLTKLESGFSQISNLVLSGDSCDVQNNHIQCLDSFNAGHS